ncbi:MAG TPA: hypothetical protein VFM96_05650 [Gaiellaceae bacterium]|nr:hypothetical protein [Gaiellaceae bacterium]
MTAIISHSSIINLQGLRVNPGALYSALRLPNLRESFRRLAPSGGPMPEGKFMDAPQIMREFGFKEGIATKIIRWCANERGRVVKIEPPEGRKTFVYREDVMEWIANHEQSST